MAQPEISELPGSLPHNTGAETANNVARNDDVADIPAATADHHVDNEETEHPTGKKVLHEAQNLFSSKLP
jgi:hypothetical protein